MLGGIASGVLFNIGQDLYTTGKGILSYPLPLGIIIPVSLGIVGVGIIIYDVLSQRRKTTKTKGPMEIHEEDHEQQRRERRWRFFPANYR